ncbi:MAG: hypothetical protein NC311_03250 [Muribaculaceae bacterium]|nr:hypothetical protein [Muribaculaceae bacterium]
MFTKIVFVIICFVLVGENAFAQPNQYIRQIADDFENKIYHTDQVKLDSESANYINRVSKFSETVKFELKILYFAEKTLWQLYDDAIAMINKKSEQTGREVQRRETHDEETGEIILTANLDNGEYEDCGLKLCEYPDGFEQCFVNMKYRDVADDMFSAHLMVFCDNKQENIRSAYSFDVAAQGHAGQDAEKHLLSHQVFVSIGGSEEKYDEAYQYENATLAVRRYNTEQQKKYKKKAVLKTEPGMPGADVFGVTFTSAMNKM